MINLNTLQIILKLDTRSNIWINSQSFNTLDLIIYLELSPQFWKEIGQNVWTTGTNVCTSFEIPQLRGIFKLLISDYDSKNTDSTTKKFWELFTKWCLIHTCPSKGCLEIPFSDKSTLLLLLILTDFIMYNKIYLS